jgi:endonuclease-3
MGNPAQLRPKMRRALALLRRMYGPRPCRRWGPAVDILVHTILSQNTSDTNSSAAYRSLRRQFPSWNQVMRAPLHDVEKSIRASGLSRVKAPRIQNILRHIKADRGKIDLEFLKDITPQRAYDYLMNFKGVGPKTTNCVLLFSFGMPVFPVDTHIHRIAIRIGLIPHTCHAEAAHALLKEMIRPADRYEMHVLLITHGRDICKARNPLCHRCALAELCAYPLPRTRAQRPAH